MNKLLITLAVTLLSSQAIAEDRALLIGVGKYEMKQINLPGIELDLGMMQKTAQSLGFQHIETLQNEQATLKNVENALLALAKDVNKNDRVLIYYSGHGTSVPDMSNDETDQNDEALTMHDMELGGGTIKNVLIDDHFNELLDKIPSDHILVLLDACHSGTATRAAISKYVPKEFHWEGMGKISKTRGFAVTARQNATQSRIITLSAAQDDEQSLALPEGSLFTIGLSRLMSDGVSYTPEALQRSVTLFIKNEIDNNADLKNAVPFHPQLSGNTNLLQQPITSQALTTAKPSQINNISKLSSTSPTMATNNGTMAQRLSALQDKAQPLTVHLNQSQFKKGDKLVISVTVTQSGYLNIIEINSNDQATILFPNQYHQDNQVEQGNFALPTAQMNFDFTAGEPFGHSTVLAFLTKDKVNLYQYGQLNELFKTVSEKEMPGISLAFNPTQKQQAVLAGKVETKVCDTDTDC